MKTLKIRVTTMEEMLGTSSSDPKAHGDYIAVNAPDVNKVYEECDIAESTAKQLAETIEDTKGITVFPRDENGQVFVWDYQWKGFFKDACGSLRRLSDKTESAKLKNYKKEIDGLIFVTPRRIPVKFDGEITICKRPLRGMTPQGERIALAYSEAIPAGAVMEFEIVLYNDAHEKVVREWLKYGRMRGFGQWRNSGKGRFDFEILDIVEEEFHL